MKRDIIKHHSEGRSVFFYTTALALFAYVSRIAEIFPILATFRINFVLLVLALVTFMLSGSYRRIWWKGNHGLQLMMALLFLAICLLPFSIWKGGSIVALRDVMMINFFLFVFCQVAAMEKKGLIGIIQTLAIVCFFLLFGMYYNPVIVEEVRVATTATYDPNDIAMILVCFLPFVVYLFVSIDSSRKLILIVLVIFIILGVIKTGSRGGLLALLVAIIQIVFSAKLQIGRSSKLLVTIIITASLFSSYSHNVLGRWQKVITGEDYNISNVNSPTGGRIALWKSGVKLFQKNFITGVGIGNITVALGKEYGDKNWKTIHNSYLQIGLELGVAGLGIYLLLLRYIWKGYSLAIVDMICNQEKVQRNIDLISLAAALRIALVAYMVAAFFLSQAYSVIIPIFLALSGVLRKIENE